MPCYARLKGGLLMKWLTILMIVICLNILMFIHYFYYSDDVTKNLEYEECTRYFYDYHYIMDSSEPNT